MGVYPSVPFLHGCAGNAPIARGWVPEYSPMRCLHWIRDGCRDRLALRVGGKQGMHFQLDFFCQQGMMPYSRRKSSLFLNRCPSPRVTVSPCESLNTKHSVAQPYVTREDETNDPAS